MTPEEIAAEEIAVEEARLAEEARLEEEKRLAEEEEARKKAEGGEDVSALKRALERERKERKEAKEKLYAYERDKKKQEEARAKEKGEFKSLYEKALLENEALKKEMDDFKSTIQKKELETKASKIAQKGTTDAKRLELLKKEVLQHAKYTDEGEVIFEVGGVEIDEKRLLENIKQEYPFLFDGTKASGSGATGSGGGAANTTKNPFKKETLNLTEQAKLMKTDPALAAQLKAAAAAN